MPSFYFLVRFVLLVVVVVVVYVVGTVIYRLTFHPLAKYPGPFWARITNWNNWYHADKGDRHLELWRQHEVYGPVVRFRPNALSFNSIEALQDIYGHKKNVRKGDWYAMIQAACKGQSSTVSERDKGAHAVKRRLLSHGFSDGAVRSLEPSITSNVEKWCEALGGKGGKEGWSEDRNMSDWANYLAFEILADLSFSKSFGLLESAENRYVIDLIASVTKLAYSMGQLPFRAVMRALLQTPLGDVLGGQVTRDNRTFNAFGRKALAERKERELGEKQHDRRDFFHYLFRGRDPETGVGYTDETLGAESELLIIAGSDTSSTVLAATFFYLVHNPRVLRKLAEVLRETFASVEEIRYSNPKVASLAYLQAVLNESMRMSPPVGAHIPREVLPGGATIEGIEVPATTIVGVPAYTIHHNEEYYRHPFDFWPERWIVDEDAGVTAESVETARAAFATFSLGPRNCIGKTLAMSELTTAMGQLLWLYDIRAAEGSKVGEGSKTNEWGRRRKDEFQMEDNFVAARDGPIINFKRRVI